MGASAAACYYYYCHLATVQKRYEATLYCYNNILCMVIVKIQLIQNESAAHVRTETTAPDNPISRQRSYRRRPLWIKFPPREDVSSINTGCHLPGDLGIS